MYFSLTIGAACVPSLQANRSSVLYTVLDKFELIKYSLQVRDYPNPRPRISSQAVVINRNLFLQLSSGLIARFLSSGWWLLSLGMKGSHFKVDAASCYSPPFIFSLSKLPALYTRNYMYFETSQVIQHVFIIVAVK